MSLLTAEIDAVDGVSVESIRLVDPERTDASLSALALGAAIAESDPIERLDVMVAGIERFAETDWVVVLADGEPITQLGSPPDVGWLTAFLAGSEHLDGLDDSAPSDLLWGHMVVRDHRRRRTKRQPDPRARACALLAAAPPRRCAGATTPSSVNARPRAAIARGARRPPSGRRQG